MGLPQAINEAKDQQIEDMVRFLMSEFEVGCSEEDRFAPADNKEVVAALKAWAYMNLNAPGVE